MTQPFVIKCALRSTELSFVGLRTWLKGGRYFQIRLTGSEFAGHSFESSKGCAYDPQSGLTQFFAELATHCAGWEGVKYWESSQCGLSFAAWLDEDVGHVVLGVAFWHGKDEIEKKVGRRLTDPEWLEMVKEPRMQKALFVKADQLEEIAAGIKEFFATLKEAEEAEGSIEPVLRLTVPDE